jgi:dTDP-4-dehydrorhamnose reductase
MIAVVGATGLVGSAVEKELRAGGHSVVGTSRRPTRADHLRLDISDAASWNLLPSDTTAVLVCAGVSDVRECRNKPDLTRAVNVSAAAEFAKFVAARGAIPVMLSTSHVFDGSRSDFASHDVPCPRSEYGRQKADMEKLVIAEVRNAAIVRVTKIFGAFNALVSGWRRLLAEGKQIKAASDARLSPLRSGFVGRVLAELLVSPRPGLWQLSADDDVSWAEIAQSLAERCEAGRAVQACSLVELDPFSEFTPARGSLKLNWPFPVDSQLSVLAVDRLLDSVCFRQ